MRRIVILFFGEVIDLHLNEGLSGAKVTIDKNSFVVSNQKENFQLKVFARRTRANNKSSQLQSNYCKIDIPHSGLKKFI